LLRHHWTTQSLFSCSMPSTFSYVVVLQLSVLLKRVSIRERPHRRSKRKRGGRTSRIQLSAVGQGLSMSTSISSAKTNLVIITPLSVLIVLIGSTPQSASVSIGDPITFASALTRIQSLIHSSIVSAVQLRASSHAFRHALGLTCLARVLKPRTFPSRAYS
jgi:hypothetical protein